MGMLQKSVWAALCASLLFLSGIAGSAAQADRVESPLQGLSVGFFGDSICYARGEQTSANPTVVQNAGWAGRIGTRYGVRQKNYAMSGYAICDVTRRGTVRSKMKESDSAGDRYDLVILEGGTNDAWDTVPLGTVTEGFDGPFNLQTFAGSLEETISQAKRFWPDAKIGYLIMYRMPNAFWEGAPVEGLREHMDEYVDMTCRVLAKWDVPYLDLYHDDDFNRNVMKVDTTECLGTDGIHPNSQGYEVLTPRIGAFLETILPRGAGEEQEETQIDIDTGGVSTDDAMPKWVIPAAAAGAVLVVGGAVGVIVAVRRRKRT